MQKHCAERAASASRSPSVKRRLGGCLAMLALLGPFSAQATLTNFTGYYDTANPPPYGNWTKSLTGDASAAHNINNSSPLSLIITGPSSTLGGTLSLLTFTIPADIGGLPNGLFSFDWSYSSTDSMASEDISGYILGGSSHELARNLDLIEFDPGTGNVTLKPFVQGSVNNLPVTAGETIGFYLQTHTTNSDAGVLTITNFDVSAQGTTPPTQTPEPATLPLFGVGALGAFIGRRRSNA